MAKTAKETSRDRFLSLLRNDILKLDLAELDFGIYRVLNYRRVEIEEFLTDRLPKLIERVLEEESDVRLKQAQTDLSGLMDDLQKSATGLGLAEAFPGGELDVRLRSSPKGEEYLRLEAEIAVSEASKGFSESEEERLYNHLYTFFSRYYSDGDFLLQLRRGRGAKYVAPYSGEDTHFHWKSRGSHYLKTTEELRSYTFKAGSVRVRFELVEATEDRDNIKGTIRYFIPITDRASGSKDSFTVPFAARGLTDTEMEKYEKGGADRPGTQDQIVTDGLRALADKLPEGADPVAVERHLRRYVRKNRTDYFVHPKLGPFLKGELDHYLKTEFLDADGFTSPKSLVDQFVKFRTLREIGDQIIDFLHQIESFQARLFEKRKFVLRADYLVPIRHVPDELWDEVLVNEGQVQAWRDLFGLNEDVTRKTLETHPTLVVDTRHFEDDFRLRAVSGFDDLDESTDGILINGENYAALRTLEHRFRNEVKLTYIDPPYNTGSDDFIYKDDFSRHSTWLTMMSERLLIGRDLLSKDGVIFISTDDNEQSHLKELLDEIFGNENFLATVIWQKNYAPRNTAKHFSEDHDFLLVAARSFKDLSLGLLPRSDEAEGRYANPDNDSRGLWKSSDLLARNYYSKGSYEMSGPTGKKFKNATGTYWRVSKERFEELDEDGRIWWGPKGSNKPALKRFRSEVRSGIVPQTIWEYGDVGHTQDAKRQLLSIVVFERTEDVLNTVKPLGLVQRMLQIGTSVEASEWVLDFFAGSGTTGHATIQQNREDGGNRKFLIIELGEYFDAVTFQRIVRTMYAPEWKNGVPKEEPKLDPSDLPDWANRGPRIVKILQFENFESSLDSLELATERTARVAGQVGLLEDEFLIRYLLPVELDESVVLLNTEALTQPFSYRLNTHTPEGVRETPVDLVDTFNLLMGLHVRRIRGLTHNDRAYRIVEATEQGQSVLVIWRSITDLDPKAERTFLEGNLDLAAFDKIYVNGDSALPGAESLDAEFKRRMLEPDPNFP